MRYIELGLNKEVLSYKKINKIILYRKEKVGAREFAGADPLDIVD